VGSARLSQTEPLSEMLLSEESLDQFPESEEASLPDTEQKLA